MATLNHSLLRVIAAAFVLTSTVGCSAESKRKNHLSRGNDYFKAGEYEKAKIEYANVLQGDPQNGVAIRQMGLIWIEQGVPLRALPFLLNARVREPANLELQLKIAQGLAGLGNFPEARKEAIAILEKAPANQEAALLLAETPRNQEEFDEALKFVSAMPSQGGAILQMLTATTALRKQDMDAAQAALEQAVAAEPNSAPIHASLGNLHLIRRKLDEAGAEYKKAAELSPARSAARIRYGDFLMQRGQGEQAIAWIDAITKAAPDYIPAWTLRARIALAEKKLDEALAHLKRVFGIDGANFEGRLLEGQVRLAKGEVKQSVEGLEALDKDYPNVSAVKYHLARSYMRAGNLAQATSVLTQVIGANPDFTDAILLLADLDLRAGDTAAVIDAMLALLKKHPELSQAQLNLAEAYRKSGRLVDAAAILEKNIAAVPDNPQPQLLLGLVLRQQGKVAQARETFEKVEKLVPDSLLPLSQLVDLDLSEKNYAAALQKVDDRLAKDPKLAGAYYLKGRIHALQSDWDNAEATLKKAIELAPDFVGAYDMLSQVYVMAGRLQQAIDQLNELLAKDPNNTQALMLAGTVYTQMKEHAKAQGVYEKLLVTKPEFPPALNNLAWLCSEFLNEPVKALEFARKARSLQPTEPAIADTYGWVLYRQGQYQQSLAVLREAAAQLSQNPEVSYHLGMAAYMMGEKELARQSLETAAGGKEPFPGKEEIASRLALLGGGQGTGAKLSVAELKALVEKQPRDTVAWMELAAAYEATGAIKDATAAYESAVAVNPKLLPALLKLAQINADVLKNDAKALELARSAREVAPNDPAVAALVGRIALKSRNYEWAHSLLQDGAKASSADPAVLSDFAWANYGLGRVKEALEIMQRLINGAPQDQRTVEARKFLRFVPSGNVAPEATPEEVEAVLKAEPGFVPALMVRAAEQEKKGDRDGAIASYSVVLEKMPAFSPAQKKLAALYADRPETLQKAYTLAVEARKTLPDDAELAKTVGVISYKRGEFAYAVQVLSAAAKSAPLAADELFYLGMGQWKTKKAEAGATIQKALDSGLAEPKTTEARQTLAAIQGK